MIKQTHRRGQLTPRQHDAIISRVQTLWERRRNCTVMALQRSRDIESHTREELTCIDIVLDCWMGRKDRWFILTQHEWKAVIATSKDELGKPRAACLLSFNTRRRIAVAYGPGSRSHPCFRSKTVHHAQIPEVQPSEYHICTLPAPIHTTLMPLKLRMTLQRLLKNL